MEGGSETEETEADMWEESFGGHTDTKPNGPEAVAMDFAFTGPIWKRFSLVGYGMLVSLYGTYGIILSGSYDGRS